MNRHTAITIAAAIVIIAPFAASAANIAGAEQIQYRWDSPGMFTFYKMSTNGSLEFCNTLPFWASFESFEITSYYQGKEIGTYATGPFSMGPLESDVQKGVFKSEYISEAYSVFMSIDYGVSSGEMRIDPRNFVIVTDVSTPILGLVPYHTTHQISGLEFVDIMEAGDTLCG